MNSLIPIERIESKILLIRSQKVLMDRDLAELYGVETGQLKRAVRRNIDRFPDDFMFELTKEELENWRCQFGTSNADKIGLRYRPMAFTEQGVAMLSSVLNSKRAILVNIQIMRTFTRLRKMVISHEEFRRKFEEIEERLESHDTQFNIVFNAIKELMEPPPEKTKKIGFIISGE